MGPSPGLSQPTIRSNFHPKPQMSSEPKTRLHQLSEHLGIPTTTTTTDTLPAIRQIAPDSTGQYVMTPPHPPNPSPPSFAGPSQMINTLQKFLNLTFLQKSRWQSRHHHRYVGTVFFFRRLVR